MLIYFSIYFDMLYYYSIYFVTFSLLSPV